MKTVKPELIFKWDIEMVGSKRHCTSMINKVSKTGMPLDVATYIKAAISCIKLDKGMRIFIRSFGKRTMRHLYSTEYTQIQIVASPRHGRLIQSYSH